MKRVLSVFAAFMMVGFSANAFAQSHYWLSQVDAAASQLDLESDHLHEDLHDIANFDASARRLDAAASALHEAAHHMHETAHYGGSTHHLRVDFHNVDFAYRDVQREWRYASYQVTNDYHLQQVMRDVSYAFNRLARLMRGGGCGGGGIHTPDSDNSDWIESHERAVEKQSEHAEPAEHEAVH